ncbi:DUF222 domain-containing protein [Mycobacterium neumannii]|uniref:DUF222 domain-containing protein n=1 Tax=Mycobacterium neumannii TaxID=2048551 RepID=UPI000B942279
MSHSMVAGLGRAPIEELGENSVAGALAVLLRLSKAEAHRRVAEAKELAPRRAMTGETLEPVLAHTAAAVEQGLVGAEHVRVIRRFFDKQVPASTPFDVREAAEGQLAQLATKHTPEELRAAAQRLAAYLNPDGDFSDELRAAQRWLRLGRQRLDGMSELRGLLDPATRAALEAVLAVWAAPGAATPTAKPRARTVSDVRIRIPRRRRTRRRRRWPLIGARSGSATTMRSMPCAGSCSPRARWAAITACRRRC